MTGRRVATPLVPVFDLDGTLLDSDAPLVQAFVDLGVARHEITFGHVVADECARLGIDAEAYLDAYDVAAAQPFPGVGELLAGLDRWAVCSNKVGRLARRELDRLGWHPQVALFAEDFDGPKSLPPVLHALGVDAGRVLFVGDTDHDRRVAAEVGAAFALAAWNPRARPTDGDLVLTRPAQLDEALGG